MARVDAIYSDAGGVGAGRWAEADELDERHRSRVALADARLEDARVATLARREVRADLGEQALQRVARLHRQARLAARVKDLGLLGRRRLVALGDQRVRPRCRSVMVASANRRSIFAFASVVSMRP